MAQVTALYRYPIKACRAEAVDPLEIDDAGPVGDRLFMLVNERGTFLSQRGHPTLATVSVSLSLAGEGPVLRVASVGAGEGTFVFAPTATGPRVPVRVWKDEFEAVAESKEADDYFSALLGQPVHLVRYAGGRIRTKSYVPRPFEVRFPDGAPLHLLSEASVADLNRRLEHPVPANRFRANILVDAATPYEEDGWREIALGTLESSALYPCDRCVVTTTDQATGLRGAEPLSTLSTYRKVGDEVLFGVQMVPRGPGIVRVGDTVRARSTMPTT